MPRPVARTATRAALGLVLIALVVTGLAPGAQAAQVCEQPPTTDSSVAEVPWDQRAWDPETEVWPFSTGAGVTVAVLDTGVQASHPQLQARVSPGIDLVRSGSADVDCVPHGSGLAGVIAATASPGVGLRGLAPDAQVLPVQVVDQPAADPDDEAADPALLAAGLQAAVTAGAQVVLVGPVVFQDDPVLADAVAQALAAGTVVVAGVGDGHDSERDGAGPTSTVATPYPAAYPGVIGVAAVGTDGLRAGTSQIGNYVDLAAPGVDIVSTGTTAQQLYQGTAFAAASVAATAALLVAEPGLVPTGAGRAAAVQARLAATALPPPAATGYGAGVVAPGRALTEDRSGESAVDVPGYRAPAADPAAAAADRSTAAAALRSTWWAAGAAGLALLVVLTAVLLPRARRRRWRAGRIPAAEPEREPAGFVPGAALFQRHPRED